MKTSGDNKEKIDNLKRNLLDELKNNNLKNNMDRKKGKERDYGRGRNNNINNYEKNYLPFLNYYNYLENGENNSNNNNDNSSSYKFSNYFDIHKKKFYK